MGVGITVPLVTFRLVESGMAGLGVVLTRISVTLQMWSARSPCGSPLIFAHWSSLLWVTSSLNLASFATSDASKLQHFCNWTLLNLTSWLRRAHQNSSCLWVYWSWKFTSSLASLSSKLALSWATSTSWALSSLTSPCSNLANILAYLLLL